MKNNVYKMDNSIQKLMSGKHTYFLDEKEFKDISFKLKNKNYEIYKPYKDSEKVILYNNEIPDVSLYKINCLDKLRHQDILGSIMNLGISSSYLGDIIIDNDNYYFYIISTLDNFIKDNLNKIGSKFITLEKIDIKLLESYERKYEENEIIVSSLRIDNVISKIINTNRKEVLNKIKEKQVILNYDILTKNEYVLKENDIFSIRKHGKYKFVSVVNNTKKNNLVIKYLRYI